jgi:hypothetical protein
VADPAVQEHVGDKLPNGKLLEHHLRGEREPLKNAPRGEKKAKYEDGSV